MEPTYWAVAALNALSVDLEERKRTVEFLQGRQFPNGGFNEGRSSTPRAFLSSTFHAVEALHMLGEKPKHAEDCVSWLRDHQELNPLIRVFGRPYGGFASGEPEAAWSALTRMEKASLLCTHEAVKALSTLGSRPKKVRSCISYALKQRTRFGFGRGWSFDTLCAVSVLESLDSVGEIDRLP
jgi:prenyltransferase beta subunit